MFNDLSEDTTSRRPGWLEGVHLPFAVFLSLILLSVVWMGFANEGFVSTVPLTLIAAAAIVYFVDVGLSGGNSVTLTIIGFVGAFFAVLGWMIISEEYGSINPYYGLVLSLAVTASAIFAVVKGR